MADGAKRSGKTIALFVGAAILVVGAASVGGALWFLSRYITRSDADSATAAATFEAARARFAGTVPLVEYRASGGPVIHRTPNAPRQPLAMVHVLVFSATDEELTRADIPFAVLRIKTLGGRLGLMSLGMMGSSGEELTLNDLERHGPGLIFESTGSMVGQPSSPTRSSAPRAAVREC